MRRILSRWPTSLQARERPLTFVAISRDSSRIKPRVWPRTPSRVRCRANTPRNDSRMRSSALPARVACAPIRCSSDEGYPRAHAGGHQQSRARSIRPPGTFSEPARPRRTGWSTAKAAQPRTPFPCTEFSEVTMNRHLRPLGATGAQSLRSATKSPPSELEAASQLGVGRLTSTPRLPAASMLNDGRLQPTQRLAPVLLPKARVLVFLVFRQSAAKRSYTHDQIGWNC